MEQEDWVRTPDSVPRSGGETDITRPCEGRVPSAILGWSISDGPVAQQTEQRSSTPQRVGANPTWVINSHAPVEELADSLG